MLEPRLELQTFEEMVKGYVRHDRIFANLESNQIVMGKAIEGIREDMRRMTRAINEFIDAVSHKFKDPAQERRLK